jgi:deoxyhypusine synthase
LTIQPKPVVTIRGVDFENSISRMTLRGDAAYVSVLSEATLAFPVFVAATFAANFHRRRDATRRADRQA